MGQFFRFPNSRATVPQTMDPFDLARLRRIGTGANTYLVMLTTANPVRIPDLQNVKNPTYVRLMIGQLAGGFQNWVMVSGTDQIPNMTTTDPIKYSGHDELHIPPDAAGSSPSIEAEYVLMPGESFCILKFAAGNLRCKVTWRDLEVTP